jgi:hypothetical protein
MDKIKNWTREVQNVEDVQNKNIKNKRTTRNNVKL